MTLNLTCAGCSSSVWAGIEAQEEAGTPTGTTVHVALYSQEVVVEVLVSIYLVKEPTGRHV